MNKVSVTIKKWSLLFDKKKQLEEDIKGLVFQMEGLQQEILQQFANQEIKRMDVEKYTYYIRVDSYSRATDKDELIKWLGDREKIDLMTINAKTLTKFIKEIESTGDIVPDFIETYDKEKLVRKKTPIKTKE